MSEIEPNAQIQRCAIISCGPSALMYPGRKAKDYDCVIGVRDQVEFFHCDWWSLCDMIPYAHLRPIGRPRIWCTEYVRTKVERGCADEYDSTASRRWATESYVVSNQDGAPLIPLHADLWNWWRWSGTNALGLAWHLRPKELDIWGMDLVGRVDHRGIDYSGRWPGRWDHERQYVEAMLKCLEDIDVKVTLCPSTEAQDTESTLGDWTGL